MAQFKLRARAASSEQKLYLKKLTARFFVLRTKKSILMTKE